MDGSLRKSVPDCAGGRCRAPPDCRLAGPRKILEDVSEGVAEAASAKSETIRTATLLRPGVTEHVVAALAFVLVAQRLVGFIDFFELFF